MKERLTHLQHDCAFAATQAVLSQEWVNWIGEQKASIAYLLYQANLAMLEAYEIQKEELFHPNPSEN
jgi:hypothetical protein